ncbi:flagellin [Brevundimonas naejangsanensis]|uniref:flagellin n=1 Tax=Brevundimonas naejangsanensis TaxID=588932 RepID=UPI000EEA0831|nr:flagellin [Brevundimonas naejangsanensis]HAC02249.1 flagellin [Brevundimonas sp.]
MANSINTNVGALVALQNLNATNKSLETAQNRINTGFKVANAKDNGAIFAIATNQRAEMGALDAVKQSIQRGQSIVDVAMAAGDTVTAALTELKSLAVAIADAPAHPDAANDDFNATRLALEADFDAIVKEIGDALGGANFDGVNLFAANTGAVYVTNSTTTKFELKAAAGAATTATSLGFDGANRDVATVQSAIESFTATLADLGTKSKSLDRQLTFTSKLQDALEAGIGNLVDADLAKESARLTALQTKQQLGVQALSIANQSSSILLGLFR